MNGSPFSPQFVNVNHIRNLQDRIGYRLIRPIAAGGMGSVYEAIQEGAHGFTKKVAIKLIREEYSSEPAFRRNFVGEARLVSDLIHNCIVQTYHLGEIYGQYYMVMEFVNGYNLEEFILQHRALGDDVPIDLAVFIISRICRGLSYAHRKKDPSGQRLGIVHRDINPRNVMISLEGDVKITDFGIAKALNLMYNVEGEVIAGKDEYLSPEQANREITDERADLFSCGVVLAELLLGYNCFEAPGDPQTTRNNIRNMPLPDFGTEREGIDSRIEDILHRSMEKDRRKRYQSAFEMLSALERSLYDDGYGPTSEKLAAYLTALFTDGKAYDDDLNRIPKTFGLAPSTPPN